MSSTSETGHAKNVANFGDLVISIEAQGASYNPSRQSITLLSLKGLLSASTDSLNTVNVAEAAYSNAVAAREVGFAPLGGIITRVNNALKASDTTTQVDESAQTIVRKLQGRRAVAKLTEEEKKALEVEGKGVNQISTSQMSYDSRLENFDKLISLLASVAEYNPNEEELKVDSLRARHTQLKALNTQVMTTYYQLDNARNQRNDILYKPLTGLVDTAADTKTYIKSAFGATSPQYKQVSRLQFVSRN